MFLYIIYRQYFGSWNVIGGFDKDTDALDLADPVRVADTLLSEKYALITEEEYYSVETYIAKNKLEHLKSSATPTMLRKINMETGVEILYYRLGN